MKKKILYSILVLLIIIQFFRIDKTNPTINISQDFIEITKPPIEIATILKSACYDCHSSETRYPWYTNIAPVSWWIKHHIDEGKEELNFSEWGTYKTKRKDHKLEEIIEWVEDGEMPLNEYTWTHADSKLTQEQKDLLIGWVKEIRAEAKEKKNKKVLHLNNGEKWSANPETTTGVNKMFEIAKAEIEDGRVSLYAAMGERLSIQLDSIFDQCTMKGDSHEQLHLFLTPLITNCDHLENIEDESDAMLLQKDILKQLNKYNTYFE